MTYSNFADLVRYYTKTNTSTFTNTDIMLLANTYMDEISSGVIKYVNEDFFGLPAFTDLVAAQREYPLPEKLIKIKQVEAKLDGINWKHLTEFDLNYYDHPTDEEDILEQFSDDKPQFDIFRNSIWIYNGSAIVDVVGGLKLWYITLPANITDLSLTTDMSNDPTSTTAGFPVELHELLARRVSIAYKESKDKPKPLTEKEKNFNVELRETFKEMRRLNMDKVIQMITPYDDGFEY